MTGYKVADYLEQNGRATRRHELGPPALWDALASHYRGVSTQNSRPPKQ